MSDPVPVPTCAKCLEPAGKDAVLLRNGTYLCPACHRHMHPIKAPTERRRGFYVNAEGIAAMLAIGGAIFIGYKAYDYVVTTRREEAAAAQIAAKKAEQLRQEELAAAEMRIRDETAAKKAAEERREREEKELRERERLAEVARIKKSELDRAEAERKRIEDEKRLAELRESQRLQDAAARLKAAAEEEARLKEAAEAAALSPDQPARAPVTAKPRTKVIVKKDGTQINANSIMMLDDDVRYKDEQGKWQSMKKSEIAKIE